MKFNFRSDLDEIRKENPNFESEEQIRVIKTVNNFLSLKKNIDFFRKCIFLLSEAKYKAKYGKGLKIFSCKQMVQRLPIALVQVKAGHISENLLNQIHQIIYSLC